MNGLKIVLHAEGATRAEFLKRNFPPLVKLVVVESPSDFLQHEDAVLFFDLGEIPAPEIYHQLKEKPILVNAVTQTAKDFQGLKQVTRLNAWPGFLNRPVLELASPEEARQGIQEILDALQWTAVFVPDLPGLVSARILAMIINEAYFALGEGVSTREEIDIAMKTGTNYPFGPFEWGGMIGINRVLGLLQKMEAANNRYDIAPALVKEANLQP